MSENLGNLTGARLTLKQYLADYRKTYEKLGNTKSWKFERRQTFIEPGDDSWEEFERGNWAESLARFNDRRPTLLAQAREDAARGIGLYRVRVVAESISPYLLWELNVLKVRGEYGEKIRVINADSIAEFERDGQLPEIITLGGDVVYQILYADSGALEGAIRSDDRAEVERWVSFMNTLYEKGEEIGSFFARRVAGKRPSSVA